MRGHHLTWTGWGSLFADAVKFFTLCLLVALVLTCLLRWWERPALPRPPGQCRNCPHDEDAHGHYRPGADCSLCGCKAFAPARTGPLTWLREHLARVRRWFVRIEVQPYRDKEEAEEFAAYDRLLGEDRLVREPTPRDRGSA